MPPLRLEPAPDELRSRVRAPRRDGGRQRRSWSWAAPLTAAAVVVALAITLVIIKNLPNGSAVPPTPSTSTGPGGIPRYYVTVTPTSSKFKAPSALAVGDSLTGRTIATFAPPAGTTFASVSGAADDRTFVVLDVANPYGPKPGQLDSWYAVKLSPGTAHPATLTHLPIEPRYGVGATALSASGRELAVATDAATVTGGPPVKQLTVFSLATGQALHTWSTKDATAPIPATYPLGVAPSQFPVLTWIDNDRAITFTTISQSTTGSETVRKLNVSGPGSGDLMADSQVIWTAPTAGKPTDGDNRGMTCALLLLSRVPPLVSADGKTVSCATVTLSADTSATFTTYRLATGTTAASQGTIAYQVSRHLPGGSSAGGELLWASPSGGTLIGEWEIGSLSSSPSSSLPVHLGVISHGKFTPLPSLAGFTWRMAVDIAW
ncbi:MAG: hypothetical protein ACRDOI_06405 [Trebonia sp.]